MKPGDALRNHVSEIRKAGERGAGLTRQLLAFSRKQIIEPKPVNLNTLVADSENMLRRVMGEDVEILTLCDDSLRQVVADAGQINQVLLNLAVNARDAMPAGGKLIIETTNTELDASYVDRHPGVAPGRYVLLTVTDNGVGMDQQTLQRIFEPFFTTKEQGRGTGLGLSTAYGIVKQNGGFISVYSEPGRGTAFRIYLPAIAGGPAAEKEAEPVATVAGGSETILLVEDQEEVRTLAAKVLTSYGYRVLEGSHGEDALLLAKLHPEPIHLLLTDVIMPGMTGRELAERLKPLRPGIKVVVYVGVQRKCDHVSRPAGSWLGLCFEAFHGVELGRQGARSANAAGHPRHDPRSGRRDSDPAVVRAAPDGGRLRSLVCHQRRRSPADRARTAPGPRDHGPGDAGVRGD